jgi:ubiquinone biosynthesis protein UbiJ
MHRVKAKRFKNLLATEVGFCRMRLPRLSRSANRFFKKQIKQCVWALAEMIGENQIINVSDSTIRKSKRETKH